MESHMKCPLCSIVLDNARSAICPGCRLWWSAAPATRYQPDAISDDPPLPLRLSLRNSGVHRWVGVLFMLPLGCLGLGAALAALWSVALDPWRWTEWVKVLVGLPLGGWVGTHAIASVIGQLIHVLFPSQLAGEPAQLRANVWNTWEGVWQSFRRVEVKVPRDQVTGVVFSTGQGGETQLFILHASGLAFGTGWSGTKEEALRNKEPLLRWMAARERLQDVS